MKKYLLAGLLAFSTGSCLAATYGTSCSSCALLFRGSDSAKEQNRVYRNIIDRENSI